MQWLLFINWFLIKLCFSCFDMIFLSFSMITMIKREFSETNAIFCFQFKQIQCVNPPYWTIQLSTVALLLFSLLCFSQTALRFALEFSWINWVITKFHQQIKMVTNGGLTFQAGEEKSMKNSMIRYILNVSTKKTPIKSGDIVKQCLRGEHKWFQHLFPEVEAILIDVSNILDIWQFNSSTYWGRGE